MSEKQLYSSKKYIIGFLLCFVLTVIPFSLFAIDIAISTVFKISTIVICAVIQLIVQLVYFLHLKNTKGEWNVPSLNFSLIIVLIVVGGSLWIMYNLNINMMPH